MMCTFCALCTFCTVTALRLGLCSARLERLRGIVAHVFVGVVAEREQARLDGGGDHVGGELAHERLQRLCDVEANIGHGVALHVEHDGQQRGGEDVTADDGRERGDGGEERHAVEEVGVGRGGVEHRWEEGGRSPLDAKRLDDLFEVDDRRLADGVDAIVEPVDAHRTELLLEEADAQLRGEQRDALDDGEADAPLPVGGELGDSGQE
mmetsp:Transcript_28592/g.77434  ORF Transcript_28592/g.77434 Transcript_28592/m.77434 type:complete len:208 (-) Transcript_28592:306-929(-)